MTMMTITISEETFAIVHKLMSIGMDEVLDNPETDLDTMGRVLNGVTMFSTWNPMEVDKLHELANVWELVSQTRQLPNQLRECHKTPWVSRQSLPY